MYLIPFQPGHDPFVESGWARARVNKQDSTRNFTILTSGKERNLEKRVWKIENQEIGTQGQKGYMHDRYEI